MSLATTLEDSITAALAAVIDGVDIIALFDREQFAAPQITVVCSDLQLQQGEAFPTGDALASVDIMLATSFKDTTRDQHASIEDSIRETISHGGFLPSLNTDTLSVQYCEAKNIRRFVAEGRRYSIATLEAMISVKEYT